MTRIITYRSGLPWQRGNQAGDMHAAMLRMWGLRHGCTREAQKAEICGLGRSRDMQHERGVHHRHAGAVGPAQRHCLIAAVWIVVVQQGLQCTWYPLNS